MNFNFSSLRQRKIFTYGILLAFFLFFIPNVACNWTFTQLIILLLGLGIILLLWEFLVRRISFKDICNIINIRKHMRLLDTLKYGIFFGLVLFYLPLTACEMFPLHSILGGLFVELEFWEIVFISAALFLAMISLLWTQGLIIEGVVDRFSVKSNSEGSNGAKIADYIPEYARDFFNPTFRWEQWGAYFIFVSVGFGIIITNTDPWYLVSGAVVIGIAIPILIILLVQTVSLTIFPRVRNRMSKVSFISKFSESLSKARNHVLAGIGTIVSLLLWIGFFIIYRFYPDRLALAYIYILISLLIYVFSFLDYHLARFRIPSLLILILFVLFAYGVSNEDHYYYVEKRDNTTISRDVGNNGGLLTPVEVAKSSQAKEKNLVVVVSTGGGIQAAGWTTLALKELVAKRPQLIREIRLLSTVSGGTVGAAYYIHDLCRAQENVLSDPELHQEEVNKLLTTTHTKSVDSSLSAVAYGFVYLDFWRLISGGLVSKIYKDPDRDRGMTLEQRWADIATMGDGDSNSQGCRADKILELRDDILAGRIPAPIFNTTVMESGRRIMITPITFNQPRQVDDERRADTLSEFLFQMQRTDQDTATSEADLNLWTAARLSATFPYVTPAARAKLDPNSITSSQEDKLEDEHQMYHFIDGGYYDNFGVASALDWLEPVLKARLNGEEGLEFEKVVIIELRAFPVPPRTCYNHAKGSVSALAGPLVGLYNIRTGAAFSRNEIELDRFINTWQEHFRRETKEKTKTVLIDRFIFQPPIKSTIEHCEEEEERGPLSWHLSRAQIENLAKQWTHEKNEVEWERMIKFLEQAN